MDLGKYEKVVQALLLVSLVGLLFLLETPLEFIGATLVVVALLSKVLEKVITRKKTPKVVAKAS